jgi:probable rRNA maturation factor
VTAVYVTPWRIDVTLRDAVVDAHGGRRPIAISVLARAIAAALDAGGAPAPASIGLILSDDAELAALNAEHLGHEGPTDVLSFPLLPAEAFPPHPGAASRPAAPAERPAPPTAGAPPTAAARFAQPPGRRVHLGDIVLSVERATEQALEGRGGQTGDVRWSVEDELRLLVTHGALHVCGWDHAEADEEREMRALEQRLLGAS